jgi:hypothetical protein
MIIEPLYKLRESLMPFRSDTFLGTYNPDQLRSLQHAYRQTCIELGRTNLTLTEQHRLAKIIYGIYDSGIEDPVAIARIVRHAESI